MKKQGLANALMTAIIVVIALSGILAALYLRPAQTEVLGSEFTVTPIPEGRLESLEAAGNTCTITILCDTVLSRRESLNAAKAPYVPNDGIILGETTVELGAGETAFDVLQRVCAAADIQLEYSWTPLYDSYYVEGISHLYEFDCGSESGWLYQVNGVFPNYGCSAYEVRDGDAIIWRYTCVGLGVDVGAKME